MKYQPQLATLVEHPPGGDEWLHEIKFDGYRIGCIIRSGRVTLMSRNGKDWTSNFPDVVEAAKKLPVSEALLDGEVAIVEPDGRTSFQALQNALSGIEGRSKLVYFAFDLLYLEGESLQELGVEERKARLKTLVGKRKTARIRYSDHIVGKGHELLEHARTLHLEGIVSKRRDAPYRPGRSKSWLKTKVTLRQEFVIGGFSDPEGARAGIGALLLGYFAGDRLVHAGRVGTGFSHKMTIDLRRQLDAIERKACPFDPAPKGLDARGAHWVTPKYVCEVEFTEWTSDGKIRHPSFQGMRLDKKPTEVVRES